MKIIWTRLFAVGKHWTLLLLHIYLNQASCLFESNAILLWTSKVVCKTSFGTNIWEENLAVVQEEAKIHQKLQKNVKLEWRGSNSQLWDKKELLFMLLWRHFPDLIILLDTKCELKLSPRTIQGCYRILNGKRARESRWERQTKQEGNQWWAVQHRGGKYFSVAGLFWGVKFPHSPSV